MSEFEKKHIRRAELVKVLSAEFAARPSGARLPSNAELRRRFGCAPLTIVRALDDLELRGEIVRIQGRGTFASCRELRTVYIFTPAPSNLWRRDRDFLPRTLEAASRRGIVAKAIYTTSDNSLGNADLVSLSRIPEHGAVIVPGYWHFHAFDFLHRRKCRVVYCNSTYDIRKLPEYPLISSWYQLVLPIRAATEEAVRRFRARGRKRIMFLHSCVHCDTMGIRAFREAMARQKMTHDPAMELYCSSDFQTACEVLGQRLREVPDCDAILANRVDQAEAAVLVLRRLGRAVPRDCSLIVLNDHSRLEAAGISVVDSVPDSVGEAALDILASGLPMPQVREIGFEVHDRGSV